MQLFCDFLWSFFHKPPSAFVNLAPSRSSAGLLFESQAPFPFSGGTAIHVLLLLFFLAFLYYLRHFLPTSRHVMQNTLSTIDPQIFTAIQNEEQRQSEGMELIASENYQSPAVLSVQSSVFANKYSEGFP